MWRCDCCLVDTRHIDTLNAFKVSLAIQLGNGADVLPQTFFSLSRKTTRPDCKDFLVALTGYREESAGCYIQLGREANQRKCDGRARLPARGQKGCSCSFVSLAQRSSSMSTVVSSRLLNVRAACQP